MRRSAISALFTEWNRETSESVPERRHRAGFPVANVEDNSFGRVRPESQSCRVEGCDGIVRWRDRQNHAFALLPRNSADRNSTISSAGSMARRTSRAERRGGPTSRGGPSVLPIKLSHKPPGASAGSDLCCEALSLAWFIEYMEATAVEHELEWAVGRRSGEKVPRSEAAAQCASLHLGLGSLDGERRDIDSEYIETAFCHPNCIRAGACANLKRRA